MPRFLVENNIKLSGFIDGNPVATFIIDAEHRVVCWNKACEVLTGIPAAQVTGTREHWRAFYASERPTMADLIVDGGKQADIQYFYRDKFQNSPLIEAASEAEDFFADLGASGRWLHFTAAPILDDRGRTVGAIETLQDVTERRSAEAPAGVALGERLRKHFRQTPLRLAGGTEVALSVSVGVTAYQPGDDAHSLFCRADDGMYQAKRQGKNRVVLVEPPSESLV